MSTRGSAFVDRTRGQEFVDASRATVGDQLRSLTYFRDDGFEQLYLRSDLSAEADLTGFVEHESLGFDAHVAYHGSELGEYDCTIRVFEHGFLLRVTTPEEGIFLTTDGLTLRDFKEAATALKALLAE